MANFVPRFWGSFFAIFGDFRGVNVKFCVFDPQKALPYPKRHLLVYFMKLSDKRCRLHPSSRTQKRWKKMPSRLYMLGICRQVTPYANVMKFGTVGSLGYVIALTAVGPHRLTGFGVSRHQSWVPSIDKAHRAYYTAVPATAGTHDSPLKCGLYDLRICCQLCNNSTQSRVSNKYVVATYYEMYTPDWKVFQLLK